MKPWIIVLIVLAVIAVILGLLYYFGKKAQTKQAAQQEQMEAMKQNLVSTPAPPVCWSSWQRSMPARSPLKKMARPVICAS